MTFKLSIHFHQGGFPLVAPAPCGTLSASDAMRVLAAMSAISIAQLAAQLSQLRGDVVAPKPPEEIRFKGVAFRSGENGRHVKDFQRVLQEAGYDLGPKGADGHFSATTEAAARDFLAKYGSLEGWAAARDRAAAR